MPIFIKQFFIILCSFYFFEKLLNIHTSKWNSQTDLFLSICITIIYCISTQFTHDLSVFIADSIFFIATIFVYKVNIKAVFATSVISFALSYITYTISAIPITFCDYIIHLLLPVNELFLDCISCSACGILQLFLAKIPFTFRRLSKGMPYLQEGNITDVGVMISFLVLLATSFVIANPGNNTLLKMYLSAIVACSVLLVIWWLNRLVIRYREKIKSAEIERLEWRIKQLNDENTSLRQNNDVLSKIIHKDNKLIPAMELSVRESLESISFSNQESRKKAEALLRHLEQASKKRAGILSDFQNQHQSLPQTNISSVDSVIRYMGHRAYSEGVHFNFSLTGSVKYLAETVIDEHDLITLVADLLENALIAMHTSEQKTLLLCIGIENAHYTMDVYDSGIPFGEEVLPYLGKQRVTSHAETGGSGIGMMTTFEILKKCAASYVLDEVSVSEPYSKKISICFDGLNQFRVKSNRPELLDLQLVRPDIILI